MKNSFLLTKWYLDCVQEIGDAAILYVADLRWNASTVHYGKLAHVTRAESSYRPNLTRANAVPNIG